MANQSSRQLEGGAASQLLQIMRSAGYNKPVDFLLGTVEESPPNLRIKLDTDGLILERDDLIVSRTLTRHERIMTIEHVESTPRDVGDKTAINTSTPVVLAYTHSNVKMTFEDVLKVGERVILAELKEDMMYIVLDVAEFY